LGPKGRGKDFVRSQKKSKAFHLVIEIGLKKTK